MSSFADLSFDTWKIILSFALTWHDVLCVVHRLQNDSYNEIEDLELYLGGWRTILIKTHGNCHFWSSERYLSVMTLPVVQRKWRKRMKHNWNFFMKYVHILCQHLVNRRLCFNSQPPKTGLISFSLLSHSQLASAFAVEYCTPGRTYQIPVTDTFRRAGVNFNQKSGFRSIFRQFIKGDMVSQEGGSFCHVVIANNPDSILLWRSISVTCALKLTCHSHASSVSHHEMEGNINCLKTVPTGGMQAF